MTFRCAAASEDRDEPVTGSATNVRGFLLLEHTGPWGRTALLDARLAKQPWMLGEAYSLVDLSVGSVIGYSAYIGAPVDRHPHVLAWLARVQARPAMQIEA